MGMVQGAVYDAVNAIGPKKHRPYLLNRRTGAKASIDAAVATAAYDVLSELVNTAPETAPFPGRAGLLATLSNEYQASLDAIGGNSSKKQGIRIGHAAAKAMHDARKNDGRFGPSQWVPNTAPGHWQPLTNAAGQPILDPTPWAGGVKPFLIQSSSQFRSAAATRPRQRAVGDRVQRGQEPGQHHSSTRTPEQTYRAKWWQSAPVLSWNEVARQLITRTGLNAADSARLLALQNLSGADAAINCWNDKYHFDFWRPWNAIPRAARRRERRHGSRHQPGQRSSPRRIPSGSRDTTASTRHTSPFSGCSSATYPKAGPSRSPASPLPGSHRIRRCANFDTFSQPLAELIEARIWAGLHYRSADVAGQALGGNVANYAISNYFQPVGH